MTIMSTISENMANVNVFFSGILDGYLGGIILVKKQKFRSFFLLFYLVARVGELLGPAVGS